jgi:hypothetical protein
MNTRIICIASIACFPIAALLTTAGCRTDPGTPDYRSQEQFDFGIDAGSDALAEPDVPQVLPGPDPWEPGEDRLSIGTFYEGGSSDAIIIDDVQNFLFIFESSLSIQIDTDRIEGLRAHRFVLAGTAFWGMGIFWLTEADGDPRPEDLSSWETLHISFKSSDAPFDDIEISMADAAGSATVLASDYGYANDGEWHTLDIPTSDFVDAGLDLSAVSSPLSLSGPTNTEGAALLVDNVYFTTP